MICFPCGTTAEDEAKAVLDEEEMDAMHALENKTLDAKEEMDILDALEEVKSLRGKQGKLNFDMLLSVQQRKYMNTQKAIQKEEEAVEDEDDLHARKLFEKKRTVVKRIEEEEDGDKKEQKKSTVETSEDVAGERKETEKKVQPVGVFGGLRVVPVKIMKVEKKASMEKNNSLLGIAAYSDDSDDEE